MYISFDYLPNSRELQIICDRSDIFQALRDYFSVENEGKQFAKRNKQYIPDRKYSITPTGKCDLGLYFEIRQYLRSRNLVFNIEISDRLQYALKCHVSDTVYDDLALKLRDYQYEVVKKCLNIGYGTFVLGTGAGKTLITASLIENIYRNTKDNNTFRCLLVVPDIGLVEQTYEEINSYNCSFTTSKWTGSYSINLNTNVIICNNSILISQFKRYDVLKYVDLLVVDEVHKISHTNAISKIVKQIKTNNRFGFTGTLPVKTIDKWSVIGKIGPVLYTKSSHSLRSEDYLANVKVKILKLNYNTRPAYKKGDNNYVKELDFIYSNENRNNVLYKLSSTLNNNTLLLINHLDHGDLLLNKLKTISNKEIFYIKGETAVEERERIKKLLETRTNIVCIAMSSIFSTGINIKNIHNIIFCAGGKAFIRTVQSIGRGLRKHPSKSTLYIFDIYDYLRYGERHFYERINIYNQEKISFDINNIHF